MYVSRVDHGFAFFCPTNNGPFTVQMILADNGSEELQTAVREVDLSLPAVPLDSGTIARLLGPEHWARFLRLRDTGHEQMFL